MAYAESWHVRSRSRECAATQLAFTDGETIVTVIDTRKDKGDNSGSQQKLN